MSSSRSPHRSSADSASKGALNGDSPSPGRKNRRRLWTGVTGLSIACVVVLGWWAGTPLATLDATTPDQQVGNGETEDAGQSTLWQQYQLQWQANQARPAEARKPPPLPDVSRAGYHQGEALPALALEPHDAGEAPGKGEAEKVTPDESEKGALRRFDVTAYGADGSDTLSDRRAILEAHAAMRDWQRQGNDDADRPARRGGPTRTRSGRPRRRTGRASPPDRRSRRAPCNRRHHHACRGIDQPSCRPGWATRPRAACPRSGTARCAARMPPPRDPGSRVRRRARRRSAPRPPRAPPPP